MANVKRPIVKRSLFSWIFEGNLRWQVMLLAVIGVTVFTRVLPLEMQKRIVNQAMGYANDVIPKARGEAQQMLEVAQAYKLKKVNEAQGDAARFTQVAAEYSRAADVNGRRIYVETMEQVLPRIRKLIVDKNGNLDLTIIRKGESPPPQK